MDRLFSVCLSFFCFSLVSVPSLFYIIAVLNFQFYVNFLPITGAIAVSFIHIFIINYLKSYTYAVAGTIYITRYEFLKSFDTFIKIGICLATGLISATLTQLMLANFINEFTTFQLNCLWTNFIVISLFLTSFSFFISESYILNFPDYQEKIYWQLFKSLHVVSLNEFLKFIVVFSFYHLFHAIFVCSVIGHLVNSFNLLNYLPSFFLGNLYTLSESKSAIGYRYVFSEYFNWEFLSLSLTSSLFLIYLLIVSQKICLILWTKPLEFPLNLNDDNCLPNVLKKKNDLLMNYKAWMHFFYISKFDENSRKFFYLLSHPGKHPRNWKALVEIVSDEIKILISTFQIAIEEKNREFVHKKQIQPCIINPNLNLLNQNLINPHFNQPNPNLYPQFNLKNQGSTGLINRAKSPGFLFSTNQDHPNNNDLHLSPILTSTPVDRNHHHINKSSHLVSRMRDDGSKVKNLWEVGVGGLEWEQRLVFLNSIKNRLTWGEYFQLNVWNVRMYIRNRINTTFLSIMHKLKNIWFYTYLFGNVEDYHAKLIFSSTQKYFWIIQGFTNMICSSLSEDKYGVVQFSIVEIIELYFDLLSALEGWENVSKRKQMYPSCSLAKQEVFFSTYLNGSLRRIAFTFKQNLLSLHFKPDVLNKLSLLIAGKY